MKHFETLKCYLFCHPIKHGTWYPPMFDLSMWLAPTSMWIIPFYFSIVAIMPLGNKTISVSVLSIHHSWFNFNLTKLCAQLSCALGDYYQHFQCPTFSFPSNKNNLDNLAKQSADCLTAGVSFPVGFCCGNVAMFPDICNYSGEFNVIITDGTDGQNYKNRSQIESLCCRWNYVVDKNPIKPCLEPLAEIES